MEEREPGLRRFAQNVTWLLVAEVGAKVASFVLVILLARGLGPTAYGYFTFGLSFIPLFLALGSWGVDAVLLRELARHPSQLSPLFASGLVLRVGLGTVMLLASLLIAPLFLQQQVAFLPIALLGVALLFDEIARFIGVVFRAFERMRFHAIALLVNRFVSTGLAALVLLLGGDLVTIVAVYALGSLSAVGFGAAILATRFPPIRLRDIRRGLLSSLWRGGAPLGVANMVNMAVFRLDAVMLQAFRGPVQVAMYGVAYRFLESFLFLSWSVTGAIQPRISRSGSTPDSARAFGIAAALILTFYLPIATAAPFAASWVVVTLFSRRYSPAAPAVVWLTAASVFYGLAYLARIGLVALGNRRSVASLAVVSLVANVGLNIFAIPRYGFVGASVTTFITEVLDATLLTIAFVRTVGAPRPVGVMIVPVLSAAVMFATTGLGGLHGPSAILVGAFTFAASLLIWGRILAPEESRAVLGLIRRSRPMIASAEVEASSADPQQGP